MIYKIKGIVRLINIILVTITPEASNFYSHGYRKSTTQVLAIFLSQKKLTT